MAWSSYWSSTWGPGYEAGVTKLLYMDREGPNFRKIVNIIDRRWARIMGVLEQIMIAFDLDTAVGDRLDIIGEWLGQAREGMEDERYRRALKVQKASILSSSGTSVVLNQIFQEWTGAEALSYNTIPPAGVVIGGVVPPEDALFLERALKRARPGGVRLHMVTHDEAPFVWGSEHGAVSDESEWGSEHGATSDEKPWAHEVQA